jgi:hypothetical protein
MVTPNLHNNQIVSIATIEDNDSNQAEKVSWREAIINK